jgi:hypothetical protein
MSAGALETNAGALETTLQPMEKTLASTGDERRASGGHLAATRDVRRQTEDDLAATGDDGRRQSESDNSIRPATAQTRIIAPSNRAESHLGSVTPDQVSGQGKSAGALELFVQNPVIAIFARESNELLEHGAGADSYRLQIP